MRLYGYFRSSAAYRCRIALNLKGLSHGLISVHLVKDGGQQHGEVYKALNPQELVPALELDDGRVLTQSLSIVEYLDETYAEPPLLPSGSFERARVRAFAQVIACDLHPLNNLRILHYLKGPLEQDQATVDTWYRHWVGEGLRACEALLSEETGPFCFGDVPGLADLCLVPQMFNARRFGCDLSAFPKLVRIDAHCNSLKAFDDAAPGNQPDAA